MPEVTKKIVDEHSSLKDAFFSDTNIAGRTDLNVMQIEAFNKTRTLAFIMGSPLLRNHSDDLLVLLQSKDRQSRKEFIDGMKSYVTENIKKGLNKISLLG